MATNNNTEDIIAIMPISTPAGRSDPFIANVGYTFYLTYLVNSHFGIALRSSTYLPRFEQSPETVIWTPPSQFDPRIDFFQAPELHTMPDGRWYIYLSHYVMSTSPWSELIVLGGPSSKDDPRSGEWEYLGRLGGLPEPHNYMYSTIAQIDGERYLVYGRDKRKDAGGTPAERERQLWVAHLATPTEASARYRPREIPGLDGVSYAPRWLALPNGSWRGITYKRMCNNSCPGYKHELRPHLHAVALVGHLLSRRRPQWQKSESLLFYQDCDFQAADDTMLTNAVIMRRDHLLAALKNIPKLMGAVNYRRRCIRIMRSHTGGLFVAKLPTSNKD